MDGKRFRKRSVLEAEEEVADNQVTSEKWHTANIFFCWNLISVNQVCKEDLQGQYTDLELKQYMYKREGMKYQSKIPPT